MIPTPADTSTAAMIAPGEEAMGHFSTEPMSVEPPRPSKMPMIPPEMQRTVM